MNKKLTRKERDYYRHRSEIMEVAEELFEKVGYHNTTMDLIAKESEFSKGSIYNYFESKEVLFFEIIDEKSDEFNIGLTNRINESQTIDLKICALIDYYIDFFSNDIGFYQILQNVKYSLIKFSKKEFMDSLREKHLRHIKEISAILKLNNHKSQERSILISSAIDGMLNGLINRILFHEDKIEVEQIKEFAKNKIQLLIK